MPNTSVVFKKKTYNSSTDNTAGTIVFDNTTNTIWMGGVQYSQIPNKTKTKIYTSFNQEYIVTQPSAELTYFGSDAFINSLGNNIDNSYNLIVINNSIVTSLNGPNFLFDIKLPTMTLTNNEYVGGENIHYFLIYNTSNDSLNIDLNPNPQESINVIGDMSQVTIATGNSMEFSIKVVGSYWIITRSSELDFAPGNPYNPQS